MRPLFYLLFFLLPVFSLAQTKGTGITVIKSDTLSDQQNYTDVLSGNWKFFEGDDSSMALPGYNDSLWETVHSSLTINPESTLKSRSFNSIGWFRLHFIADSSITGYPLALRISHYGASEIFLDGKKIVSFGMIGNREHTIYYDPQYRPVPIFIAAPGVHVLAVRYANFNTQSNYHTYGASLAGFTMDIGEANNIVKSSTERKTRFMFIVCLAAGIFITFSIIHLFLYLFYRATRSNLYFSLFTFALSALFIMLELNQTSHNPKVELNGIYISISAYSLCSVAFSGFINELFGSGKLRFRFIVAFGIAVPLMGRINAYLGFAAIFGLSITVLIEGIILTVDAITKKVRGARIVGAGILFFTLFFLALFMVAFSFRGFVIDDSTSSGRVIMLVAAAAILSLPLSMSIYLSWSFATMNRTLTLNLERVKRLSQKNIEQEQEKQKILEGQKEQLEEEVAVRTSVIMRQKEEIEQKHKELKGEKKKSDDLLLNILPEEVAEELKEYGHSEARFFNNVTVLFTDFVDFTRAGEKMSPQELVDELHICFKSFDEIISKYRIEKIKTIGDAYLAVCGLPQPDPEHALNIVMAACDILRFMKNRKQALGEKGFEIRIGIHSGSVVAGIVGVKKFAYDIWGDTVNTAARMEQKSEPGKINISQSTFELVREQFECTYRGDISAKNKGAMSMYFVDGPKDR